VRPMKRKNKNDTFAEFVSLIPGEGALICCLDDPLVATVAEGASCPVIGYGQGETADWRVENIRECRGQHTYISSQVC